MDKHAGIFEKGFLFMQNINRNLNSKGTLRHIYVASSVFCNSSLNVLLSHHLILFWNMNIS